MTIMDLYCEFFLECWFMHTFYCLDTSKTFVACGARYVFAKKTPQTIYNTILECWSRHMFYYLYTFSVGGDIHVFAVSTSLDHL